MLRWITTGFALVTVLATWLHARDGAVRYLLSGLVVVGAVLTLIWTASPATPAPRRSGAASEPS